MLLLEAHGKKLLADAGLPLPRSEFVRAGEAPHWPAGAAACVVKAQVPVGGRG
jgi:succinyl-CoA synthetase beta subunit